ncbi:hypothetical protein [Spongiactinospora sp. TRM90649]|uniref:hypothetical protein n=1 Tax=Spongiactinospora sp. TRM90649 TaxID=3031114 RepID=UPI0023F8CA0C|nr:hypothetical protein [Spongiactinospora sp. TRM90649]MDF5758764.1 hypothetical protein [Spongiactinospora sp. TRM90649]
MRLLGKKHDRQASELKAAQRESLIRVSDADLNEVTAICTSALAGWYGTLLDATVTRGGIVVRGAGTIGLSAAKAMRRALESVGYVIGDDFGFDGVMVIGFDPGRYSGPQLTVARIDDRIEELLALRAELLESERALPRT